jgi:hypothetical protein
MQQSILNQELYPDNRTSVEQVWLPEVAVSVCGVSVLVCFRCSVLNMRQETAQRLANKFGATKHAFTPKFSSLPCPFSCHQ